MHAVIGDCNHILYSTSILSKEVNAGLNGNNIAGNKLIAKSPCRKAGGLMDKETNRMSERMSKQALRRSGVDVGGGGPWGRAVPLARLPLSRYLARPGAEV